MTSVHLDHAAEVCNQHGATGEFVRVLTGKVTDYGDNVLFAGSAGDCVKWTRNLKIPFRLVPVTVEPAGGEVAGADHVWGYA